MSGGVTLDPGVSGISGVSYAGATSISAVTVAAGITGIPNSSTPSATHVLDELGNFVIDESGNRITTG